MDRVALLDDFARQDAVVRRLEILREAARRVSETTRDAHPEVPWRLLIGMRNVLINDYPDVNYAIVWDTVQKDLPQLI